MTESALIGRDPDMPIAHLTRSLNGLTVPPTGFSISNSAFWGHVSRLAQTLPDARYAINISDNRYLFLVGLCAAIVRGQTTLLPQTKNAQSQKTLQDDYPDSYLLHDGVAELSDLGARVDLSVLDWSLEKHETESPMVGDNQLALISFTSGSTGKPKSNHKTWKVLRESSLSNARYMLPNPDECFYHLATVPGQHMWGLETSVLLPLFVNACLVDAQPLYPQDIVQTICQLPTPVALISTPLHLRALSAAADAEKHLPRIANVLCATSPLEQALAQSIEDQFSAELREVYGCSEVGSMAVRRSAHENEWQKFEAVRFDDRGEGQVDASTTYLQKVIRLEDNVELLADGRFRLSGRVGDQVKIAGKRGSLTEVNKVLASFPNFIDGVVFFPEQEKRVPRLVAIIQQGNNIDKEALRDHFRGHLDAAFVPRPIYFVDELPRLESGKLPKAKLLALYQQLRQKKR